jgi:FKBP-type peptidyl-prolyl cis-trans isomerase
MRHLLAMIVFPLAGLLACGGDSSEVDTPGETPMQTATSAGVTAEALVGEKVRLPSGVTIEELVLGEGKEAVRGSRVTTHVLGTFTDGTKFWSNTDNPQTAAGFTAYLRSGRGGVIEGWVEGVPGMKEGGKRRIFVPWKLGYGAGGNPPLIPRKADLVFEIEVLRVF